MLREGDFLQPASAMVADHHGGSMMAGACGVGGLSVDESDEGAIMILQFSERGQDSCDFCYFDKLSSLFAN